MKPEEIRLGGTYLRGDGLVLQVVGLDELAGTVQHRGRALDHEDPKEWPFAGSGPLGPFAESVSEEVSADYLHPETEEKVKTKAEQREAEEQAKAEAEEERQQQRQAEEYAARQAEQQVREEKAAKLAAQEEAARKAAAEAAERQAARREAIEAAEAVIMQLKTQLAAAEYQLVKAQRMPS